MTQPQNLFIPADAGEKVTLPGIEITIKVTSASTGHAFAVFEEVTSPGAGPALHVHRKVKNYVAHWCSCNPHMQEPNTLPLFQTISKAESPLSLWETKYPPGSFR